MGILNIVTEETGLSGVLPRLIYIDTNNTVAEVTATGYLNDVSKLGSPLNESMMALVATQTSATAPKNVGFYDVSKSGANWSLTASQSTIPLATNQILVGDANGVAQAVAMSGDVNILASGATAIQPGAIDLAMLSAGITPSHVTKFAAQYTTTGGAAAEAITVTGALATDLAFVQVVDDGTANVTVLMAAVTANTLTVTFSGNPGADTIINYQIMRAAA